jgi:hypothetical protein
MPNLRAAALAELSPEMAEALVFIVENAKRLGQTGEEVKETYAAGLAASMSFKDFAGSEPAALGRN